MPTPCAKLEESAVIALCLPMVIPSPALDVALSGQPARIAAPTHADLLEGTDLALRLTPGVRSPALNSAGRRQPTGVIPTRADLDKWASLFFRLSLAVIAPAFDAAVRFQAAVVTAANTYLAVGAGLVFSLTIPFRCSPAIDAAVRSQPAAVDRAGADLDKWSGLVVRLPMVVRSDLSPPAVCTFVGSQPTSMIFARIDYCFWVAKWAVVDYWGITRNPIGSPILVSAHIRILPRDFIKHGIASSSDCALVNRKRTILWTEIWIAAYLPAVTQRYDLQRIYQLAAGLIKRLVVQGTKNLQSCGLHPIKVIWIGAPAFTG